MAMLRFVLIVLILLISITTEAKNSIVTIRGTVYWGSGTSNIGYMGIDPFCLFYTKSKITNKVLATCNYDEECEVTGLVNDHKMLTSIYSIRKINTNREPSGDIIKDAAAWALSVRDEVENKVLCIDKMYVSNFHTSRSDKETFFLFKFKMVGFECGAYKPREIGTGTVRMVKRGDQWYYYK